MDKFIKEGGVGRIQYNRLAEDRKVIVETWENETPFLKGLDGQLKDNIAMLFENQVGYMIKKGLIGESANASSSGSFETVAFPLIRRIYSKLLANEIVSVQAMNVPIGKLFYMNPKVSKRFDDADFAGHLRHYNPDSAYQNAARVRKLFAAGITGTTEGLTEYEDISLYDLYYATLENEFGDGLFDRSRGKIEPITGTVTLTQGTVGVNREVLATISGFGTDDQGRLIGGSGVPMDTESFLSSLKVFPSGGNLEVSSDEYSQYVKTPADQVHWHANAQAYGKSLVNNNGELEIILDLQYPEADYVPYTTGSTTDFVYVYNKYCDLEQDSEMAQVKFDLDEVTVAATTRKMSASWTPELAQDVMAFQNIDAEAELTALLSETVAAEIDREIIRDLKNGGAWRLRWDYQGLNKQLGGFQGTQKDWYQTFIDKVNQVSAQIDKATLRGGANWLIVSPEVGAMLNNLEYFHVSNADPDQDQYSMGITRIGTLTSQYTVYKDPYLPAGTAIVGRKGSSILDTGYIYAPYVPLELTGVIQNHADFTNIRGIMTRYAKKMVNNRFYGSIHIDGIPTFGTQWIR